MPVLVIATGTITGQVVNSLGQPVVGLPVVAKLNAGVSTPQTIAPVGQQVPGEVAAFTDSTGAWSLALIPNNNISPANTTYTVQIPGMPDVVVQLNDTLSHVYTSIAVNPTTTILTPVGQTIAGALTINGTVTFAGGILGPDPFYDVRAYGAKIDGVTDDTAAIQAALNACRLAGGGTVYVPAGTCIVSTAVRTGGFANNACALMYGPNLVFKGAGRGATIIRLAANASGNTGTGSNNTAILSPWNVGQEQVTFEDFTFDGNGGNQTDTMSGLYLWRQRGVKVHRVRGQDCRGTANGGGAAETFIFYGSGGTDYSFVDCDAIQTAGTCSNGFVANGCTNVMHTSCRAIAIGNGNSFGFGFNVGTGGPADSRQVTYAACHAYLCGGEGFHIDSAVSNILYDACISGGVASDIASGSQYPFTSGQGLGNTFGYTCLVAATGVVYKGCISYGNSSTGWEIRAGMGQLIGCVSKSNGGAGVNFNTGTPTFDVIGGEFSNNTAFGLGIQNSITTVRVTGGPIMAGNGTGPLNVGGTNYTPGGNVAAPGVPATTVALVNPFGYDADVYVVPGASTCAVSIAGVATGVVLASGGVGQIFTVPAKESITLTYTSAPTWKWFIA